MFEGEKTKGGSVVLTSEQDTGRVRCTVLQNVNKYIPEILKLNFCDWNITDKIAGIFETGHQRDGGFEIEISTLEKEYQTLKNGAG